MGMRPRGIVTLTEGLWEAREGTAAVRPYLEIMEATVTTECQAVEAGDGATLTSWNANGYVLVAE